MTSLNYSPMGALEVISFRLAHQDFALAISSIQEIRGWTTATPMPMSPDYLTGVVNLRGVVVPVIDLAVVLGFSAAEPTTRHVLVIANAFGSTVGLLVDAVSDILTLPQTCLQPPPAVAGSTSQAAIVAIATIGDRMISLLQLERILDAEVAQAA